ncbi:cytochrome P450 [Streptomyces jumonjinensis]|uniref:Cytochrome P450 n=1 Tax=Streptomyces jumonjinensis TaxID=1945 RepID=A0A646KIV0_STRJU|nr:cytochrome P450 [Streptomyces jumonjinensis]MQT02143.1 cytochrome P450 [Streptomyces jumonjinensis]
MNAVPASPGIGTFDQRDPAVWTDPYPVYARFRAADPVHCVRSAPGEPGVWYVFRHADVLKVRRSRGLSRAARHRRLCAGPAPDSLFRYSEKLSHWMVERDAPDHARLRAAVAEVFAPDAARALAARTGEIADELLDGIVPLGRADLMTAFAFPLPLLVISEVIGLPREDWPTLLRWSRAFSELENRRPTLALYTEAGDAIDAFDAYLRELLGHRRRGPRRDDALGRVLDARRRGALTEDDAVGTLMLLLFAGHETTANLIGNGVHTLLSHPGQLRLLRERPGLMESAVEEMLRYESPVQTVSIGHVREPFTLGGRTLLPGDRVMPVLGSANRDERVFSAPDRFDITRSDLRHAAFGTGVHTCLGAMLARVEGRAAFSALLRRLPGLRAGDAPARWREGLLTRELAELPVTF